MSKNALLSIGMLLALATGPAWAAQGTVVQYPNGTWGCEDKWGNPIPAGANGRWEGKPVVGTPCSPARFAVAGDIGAGTGASTGVGEAVGGTRPVRAGVVASAPVREAGQLEAAPAVGGSRATDYAGASFDAKGVQGLVPQPAGKSISEKGVSATKSR